MESIYNVYRTTNEISFLKYKLFSKYDKLIEKHLENQVEINKEFYILLLDELIKIPSQENAISNKKFKLLKKNINQCKTLKPKVCICGSTKLSDYNRHLLTKKHLKYLETHRNESVESVETKLEFIPFKYNYNKINKFRKGDIDYLDMKKVRIFECENRSDFIFGMYKGKLYNPNYVVCGIYHNYVGMCVPEEHLNCDGFVLDHNNVAITEYILTKAGKSYGCFSKYEFRQYYYCYERESIMKSADVIQEF